MPEISQPSYAPGALLHAVPQSAARVLVCASDDAALAQALRERGTRAVVSMPPPGDAETGLPGLDGPFDCIVCEDTIARLRNPDPLLARYFSLLAPEGGLVLAAPNLQHHENVQMLAEGRWEFREGGALARKYIRFFTGYELVRLCERHGFTAIRCRVLAGDPPAAFERDADGCVRRGRFTFGPLNDTEYALWLARDFVVSAQKPKDA